jgi:hypothetical protein
MNAVTSPPAFHQPIDIRKKYTPDWQAGQTVVTNMIRQSKTSGDSDTRHFTPKPTGQHYSRHTTIGVATNHNNPSSGIQHANEPHSNIILGKAHKTKLLVDNGSAIRTADPSVFNRIANKSKEEPPISMAGGHSNREKTRNYYRITINLDEELPYPIRNKQVGIHVINNPSLALIPGTHLFKASNTVINSRNNPAILLPEGKATIARHNKPIPWEIATAFGEGTTPNENLRDAHQSTYMLQPMEAEILEHVSQITLYMM